MLKYKDNQFTVRVVEISREIFSRGFKGFVSFSFFDLVRLKAELQDQEQELQEEHLIQARWMDLVHL